MPCCLVTNLPFFQNSWPVESLFTFIPVSITVMFIERLFSFHVSASILKVMVASTMRCLAGLMNITSLKIETLVESDPELLAYAETIANHIKQMEPHLAASKLYLLDAFVRTLFRYAFIFDGVHNCI